MVLWKLTLIILFNGGLDYNSDSNCGDLPERANIASSITLYENNVSYDDKDNIHLLYGEGNIYYK